MSISQAPPLLQWYTAFLVTLRLKKPATKRTEGPGEVETKRTWLWRQRRWGEERNTFASLTGEGVVVIPRCFISTHHTQLVLTSALPHRPHPRPPPQRQPDRSEPLNQAPTVGLGAGVTGDLKAVRAVVVRGMAELRGRSGGGWGGGGGRRAVEGEGQVCGGVLLLAVREQLEVRVLQGVAQRVSQHVWDGKGANLG